MSWGLQTAIILLLSLVLPSAYGQTSYEPVRPGSHIYIDRIHMSANQTKIVKGDFKRLERLDIQAPKGSLFEKVFGGTDSAAVLNYLEERIRYITVYNNSPKAKENYRYGVYASNWADNWLTRYAATLLGRPLPQWVILPFENEAIQFENPRIGYLNIGSLYSGSEDAQKSIGRLDTLVHEARHSDCAAAPTTQNDLELAYLGQPGHMSAQSRACTHQHVNCREHTDTGSQACDDEPFGSYGVGYVFAKAIWQYCRNCRDSQIREAAATAADDLSRIKGEAHKALRAAWLNKDGSNPPGLDMSSLSVTSPRHNLRIPDAFPNNF